MNHLVYDIGLGNIPGQIRGLLFKGQKAKPTRWRAFFILVAISMLVNMIYKKLGLRQPYQPEAAIPNVPFVTTSRYEEPVLIRLKEDITTAFTAKRPETRQKALIRAGSAFVPAGTQIGRFMGGQVFPQKRKKEQVPKFTGRKFPSKFKPKFKSKFNPSFNLKKT